MRRSLLAVALLACAACSRRDSLFPHSQKGYELYSFRVGTDWNYTLMTGTDRTKTFAEISGPDGSVGPDWVKVTARGAEKIASTLYVQLPKDEHVVWTSRVPGTSFPPYPDVAMIRSAAQWRGLQFYIAPN